MPRLLATTITLLTLFLLTTTAAHAADELKSLADRVQQLELAIQWQALVIDEQAKVIDRLAAEVWKPSTKEVAPEPAPEPITGALFLLEKTKPAPTPAPAEEGTWDDTSKSIKCQFSSFKKRFTNPKCKK